MYSIDELIEIVGELPSIGPRSARKIVLKLIKEPEGLMSRLARALQLAAASVKKCEICGNIDSVSPCEICSSEKRDKKVICVVEGISDLWAIEKAKMFEGVYHVLWGNVANDPKSEDNMNIPALKKRIDEEDVSEIVLATCATLEGQTTGYFLADILRKENVKITRLAYGIPMGANLDYMDEGTLSFAFSQRNKF